MTLVRGSLALLGAAILGCAAPAAQIRPQMDPAPDPSATEPRLPQGEAPVAVADAARRILPPEEAHRRGLMPLRSTGVQTFAALRQLSPGVRVLLASGYSESEVSDLFVETKPAGFLQKPLSLDQLVRAVQSAL